MAYKFEAWGHRKTNYSLRGFGSEEKEDEGSSIECGALEALWAFWWCGSISFYLVSSCLLFVILSILLTIWVAFLAFLYYDVYLVVVLCCKAKEPFSFSYRCLLRQALSHFWCKHHPKLSNPSSPPHPHPLPMPIARSSTS